MIFKAKFARVVCAVCLTFALSALNIFADTIRLKDGSIIKGKIVGFANGKFTVVVGDGARQRQMIYAAEEVESVRFDALPTTAAAAVNNQTAANQNATVIRVGENARNPNEPVIPPKVVTTDNSPTASPAKTTVAETIAAPEEVPTPAMTTAATADAKMKPIELNLKVLADNTANGWTNTGWMVRKGQRIRIVGDGRVSLGDGRFATPSGIASLPDNEKLMKAVATGALIAVVGDDNNEFIYVGAEREFVAARDGALFLGVNEGNLNDNSGAFDVKIEIDPNSGR